MAIAALLLVSIALGCMALAVEYRAGRRTIEPRRIPLSGLYPAEALMLLALVLALAAGVTVGVSITT